jgi:peptide/nickel transport system permease protein
MEEEDFVSKLPPVPVLIALGWLVILCLVILLGHDLSGFSPNGVALGTRLQPPFSAGGSHHHWLGTDVLGRDLMARLTSALLVSMRIALIATIISVLLGTTLGLLAARIGGLVEQAVLVLIDFQASLPFLIIALAILAIFGNSIWLFSGLMGLYGWERHARIVRALTLSAQADSYIVATRQLGASFAHITLAHLLPNIAAGLLVSASLGFPEIILMESGLSFLGLGVQPPAMSLGTLVATGRDYLTTAPWLLLGPSIVIVGSTLSISVIGDWLRDRLDPALR